MEPAVSESARTESAQTESRTSAPPNAAPPVLVPLKYVGLLALFVLAGVIWLFITLQARDRQLARTEQALHLQTLATYTGAAAVLAERGRHTDARELMTVVFDDIQRRGLAEGGSSLPANQAAVLASRDTVMLSLDRGHGRIASLLTEQFFLLQTPATTPLDAPALIDALSSGRGRTLPPAPSPDNLPLP
jgi:hypothetical protein